MMDAIERAVPGPQAEVIMHGASGGQVFGKTAPLAASAENVHHAVDHLAQINAALAAATLARRNQRLDMRPFLIGQVARIAQRVTVVAGAVFGGPHLAPHKKNRHPERITSEPHSSRGHRAQPIRSTHKVSGRTLRKPRSTLMRLANIHTLTDISKITISSATARANMCVARSTPIPLRAIFRSSSGA